MIDYEIEVYDSVVGRLTEKYDWAKDVSFSGVYEPHPPTLPFVSIVETGNRTASRRDQRNEDTYATVTYDVSAWSDSITNKKFECKKILSAVDDEMLALGFARSTMNVYQNYNDNSIYRMTARYTATIAADGTIFRTRL